MRRRGPATLVLIAMALLLVAAGRALAVDELRVNLTPARAFVRLDGEARFAAVVRDPDGEIIDAEIAWSVIPPRLGRIEGDGRFVAAGLAGRGIVRAAASHGGMGGAGHAVVEVGSEGPARLAVEVHPGSAVLEPGGVARFEAVVTDPVTGEELDAGTSWVIIPPELGTIDAAGSFTAGDAAGAGRVAVRATYGGRDGVGDAGGVVGSPSEADVRVEVAPRHALVAPGEEFRFEAVVTDASGDPIEAEVEWLLVPARLGVVDAGGAFIAGPEESVGRVVASVATREGPARGFANVEVRRPGPGGVRVRVRPREVALDTGGDVQFEASVIGPDGEPLDVPVDWAVRPAWLGTIDADGYLAVSEDMAEPSVNGGWGGTVVASIETSEGTATDASRVVVRDAGGTLRLRIRPHRPVVAPAEEVQFESIVIGAEDPADWTTEWAVFPRDLGTVTPDGLFTANPAFGDPNSGQFGPHEGAVGARAILPDGTTLLDRARVRVRIPGQPVRIRVRPGFAIVPPNESFQFDAVVLGPGGQEIDLPVTWRVAPPRLGHVAPDGTFTAADVPIDPGSWQRPRGQIVAELRMGGHVARGSAVVVIDLPDPEAVVRISPKSVTIDPGGSFQFQAETFLEDGTPIELDLEWRVADDVLGSVTQDGLFTAASEIPQGHGRRTTVIAGGLYQGRIYWDFGTVRVR